MPDHPRIQLEAGLFQTFPAPGMARVENGHIVLFCQPVNGIEQAEEVLFCVDIFFPMGRKQDILARF